MEAYNLIDLGHSAKNLTKNSKRRNYSTLYSLNPKYYNIKKKIVCLS